jgi:hypothetical protein
VIHRRRTSGLIGLWRESDRLALASDYFYTLDPQSGRKGHARVRTARSTRTRSSAREHPQAGCDGAGHRLPLTRTR